MVTVKMTSTVYYGPRGDKRRYGPGDAVQVPEGLATALGLVPIHVEAETQPPPTAKKPRTKKAS